MAKKALLSAEEICLIIEASGKAQVTTLSYGDLQIEFGRKTEVQQNLIAPSLTPQEIGVAQDVVPAPRTQAQTLAHEELKLRMDQISQMAVEDPARLEEMILNGELDEDESAGDQSE